MNEAAIISREQSNDGTSVHMYFNVPTSAWTAYGKSAYALRLYTKEHKYDSLRGYSRELQLPCTIVGYDTVKKIKMSETAIKEQEREYMVLPYPEPVDLVEYEVWTKKRDQEDADTLPLTVMTPVSNKVARDGFIYDGMSAFERKAKRFFDFILSAIALVVFSPLFLICYIAVKREDGGPAIYKQERIGRFGKPFNIYKFRSMRLDAESAGPQLSHSGGDDDPRLTKVGKFIRAHHLDELPQLWNVFAGDMSFIGPRPEREFYINRILEYDKRYTYLYQIRPGVTSYATLHNGYTDTMEKMLRRLEYDLYYLGHRSFLLDAKILVQTFLRIVFGKKF